MQVKSDLIHIKHKTLFSFVVILIALAIATPALADYLGPDRTFTESHVETYDYGVWAKKYDGTCTSRLGNKGCIVCTWERNPGNACDDAEHSYKLGTKSEVVTTTTNHPPATINSSLQNCALNNGWCVTAPQLSLSASEPLAGYNILAIEGSRNGQTFACSSTNCSVPLNEGDNNFTFWALSSWGDSSTMGTLSAKVDSQLPSITGTFSGTAGANGWYLSHVSFNGNASDITSGLASFTCTLDDAALGPCTSITVNGEGAHTLVLTARDNAGNTRTLTQNASLDMQDPSLTASLNGTLGSNNWHTAAQLNASASDATPGSGLSAFEYNLDNSGWNTFPASGVLTPPDGKHSLDLRAVDNAGRTVSSSKSFWLDSVAPNIALNPNGTLGSNDWYTTSLILTTSASDDTSGMDVFEYSLDNNTWAPYTAPLTLTEGSHNLSLWAQDSAGLVTQADRTYKVDTRVPQIAGSVSGVPGTNNWYISNVTFTASASDPLPGSGLDAFTYILNNGAETPYANALTLTDGEHTLQLNAQDKAGLMYSMEQTIKVDTIYPSLNVQTALPNWIKNSVTLNGIANDSGSGLSKVEISTDGGLTWQTASGTTSWSYIWNTTESSNGIHEAHVRVIDNAGLTTEQAFHVGIDNHAPKISLPDSWYQWDTITLDVWDSDSGLSEARIEISDPKGRWPKRKIDLDLNDFPLDFKWDRRFGDGTIAPLGTYDVKVIAFDNLGNRVRQSASINILLGFLPAGPASTSQPYVRVDSTPAPITTFVPVSSSVATTQTPVVSAFGAIPESVVQAASVPEIAPTPRAAPTQTSVLDWLESIFVPNANHESVTEIKSTDESQKTPQSTAADNSSVLWGATAAAVIGAATAYALDEKRKRKEEEARQLAEAQAKAESLNLKEQARWWASATGQDVDVLSAQYKEEGITSAMLESKRQQVIAEIEYSMQQEQPAQALNDSYQASMEAKMTRIEAEEEAQWEASQATIRKKAEEKKKAEELQAGLAAYYAAMRQGEKQTANISTSTTPINWWEKTKSFVQDKIVQPVNTYVYQPYIKPAIEKTIETVVTGATWVNENVYQPYIKPKVAKAIESATTSISWVNEHVYQPYIKPEVDKAINAITTGVSWVNENVYQPYIKPQVDKTITAVTTSISLVNEKIYQPYIKPMVGKAIETLTPGISWVNENIYQPYIEPMVNKTLDVVTDGASWINTNIYQPFIEPVVSDINRYIYQPLMDKAQNAWDKYGEWVHGGFDTLGLIPGLGEIADGINGLIYLGEGRYVEASVSALAMIPILGDLGKAGKWGLTIGKEVLEEAAEIVAKEATEELVEVLAKESLEEVAEKVVKETGEEIIEKTAKETVEETAEKVLKETGEELANKVAKESLEEVADKALKETTEEVVEKTVKKEIAEKATKDVADGVAVQVVKDESVTTATSAAATIASTASKTSAEITDEVINEAAEKFFKGEFGDMAMGKVSKLPDDILETLRTDPDSDLVNKFAEKLKELIDPSGAQPVHIDISTGTYYISKTPDEAKMIISEAKRLVDAGEVSKAIEKVKELAHLFIRGTGDKAIIGRYPFYIEDALKKGGVFFDIGESWDNLVKIFDSDRYGSFLVNEEFLYILKDYGVENIELVTDLNKPLFGAKNTTIKLQDWFDEFNKTEYISWDKMSYGQMETLAIETSPLFERVIDGVWRFK